MVSRALTVGAILLALTLTAAPVRGAEYDAHFDWFAAGAFGPLYDRETQDGFSLFPGDYAVSASLERKFTILDFRTQVGAFLYGDEIPSLDRESGSYVLLSAMDRFGEGRWALVVLGGAGYYDASQSVDFHAGVAFDYRLWDPWAVRGEAVYHREFESVVVTIGAGYHF